MGGGLSGLIPDWVLGLAGLLGLGSGGGAVGYVRRVKRTADDAQELAEQNHRQLVGDPDDPNAEGVLQIVHETRSDLLEFRMEARREHRAVMDRLEELEDHADEDV